MNDSLVTNEVKDSSGVEVEFIRKSLGPGSSTVFAKSSETPSNPYRLTVSHQETGTGINLRRRSLLRFDKSVNSDVDSSKIVTCSAYAVIDCPVGALTTAAEFKNVLANLMSVLATTGAATTVLFDCTGTGAAALIGGQI